MDVVALTCAAALAYTWLGYPLLIRALASFSRGQLNSPMTHAATVSVVIATRDASDAVRRRVTDLALTDYPAIVEIVVALDASSIHPVPAEEVKDLRIPVKLVYGDTPGGKAATLNAGVRAATGDILVFTDTQQRFAPSTVGRLATALMADERVGAVSGALHTVGSGKMAELYWRCERWLRRWEAHLYASVGVTGAVYAMRRRSWTPLPSGLILDDLYTPMRLVLERRRIAFEETALAFDARQFAPHDEYLRKARTLTGVVQLCVWLPGVLIPWRNPIWFQFVSHKLLRLLTPYLLLVGSLFWLGSMKAAVPPTVAVAALAGLIVVVMLPILLSRRVRSLVWEGVLLQAAVVKATINAVRGNWNVWRN